MMLYRRNHEKGVQIVNLLKDVRDSACGAGARWVSVVILLSVVAVGLRADDRSIQQTMNDVFDAIAYLLPLTLREDTAVHQIDKELVDRYLSVLVSSDQALTLHAELRDPEFRLLTRSFDRSIERVADAFQRDSYFDAYFALSDMAQSCVACHSRLPDDSDFLLGQKLFARMDTGALEREEIAQLYIATRQFDGALNALEKVILDQSVSPLDLDLEGILIEYLRIGITVKRDFPRLRATLAAFLERTDVPMYIRGHISVWNSSMDQLADDLNAPPTLEGGREIFDQATDLTLAPSGRARAVHDIVAASILRRALERGNSSPEQRAEAYYLLGVIALRTLGPRPAVPEMEIMLELSIRAAPGSPYAVAAYLLLEEFSHINYWDFGTREMPDPEIDIRELRGLVKGAQ